MAMQMLHVCWEERSEGNCGRCETCYRTLLALAVLGVRDRAITFPPGPLDMGRLAEVWRDKPLVVRMYAQLRGHAARAARAARAGRADIAAAIDARLARERSTGAD